jgi:hypothetical protein
MARIRTCAAALGLGLTAFAGTAAFPAAAGASDGTATITGGSLSFVSPGSVAFTAVLTGVDQTVNSNNQSFNVTDATGSGAGWNITATSTTFTTGGGTPKTLSNTATTVQAAPTQSCNASTTCTLATTNVSFPYSLPAGTTAPTATKLYNAIADTGMGGQTSVAVMRLAVPASTFAGTYTSTWTYSLVSAP